MKEFKEIDQAFDRHINPEDETGKLFYKNIDVLNLKIEILSLISKQPILLCPNCNRYIECDHCGISEPLVNRKI